MLFAKRLHEAINSSTCSLRYDFNQNQSSLDEIRFKLDYSRPHKFKVDHSRVPGLARSDTSHSYSTSISAVLQGITTTIHILSIHLLFGFIQPIVLSALLCCVVVLLFLSYALKYNTNDSIYVKPMSGCNAIHSSTFNITQLFCRLNKVMPSPINNANLLNWKTAFSISRALVRPCEYYIYDMNIIWINEKHFLLLYLIKF